MSEMIRTDQAKEDLLEIWDRIAQDSPTAADRVLAEIDRVCDMVASEPGIGRSREELAPDLRSFPVWPHVIFYKRHEKGAILVHVLRGSRDLPKFFH